MFKKDILTTVILAEHTLEYFFTLLAMLFQYLNFKLKYKLYVGVVIVILTSYPFEKKIDLSYVEA